MPKLQTYFATTPYFASGLNPSPVCTHNIWIAPCLKW